MEWSDEFTRNNETKSIVDKVINVKTTIAKEMAEGLDDEVYRRMDDELIEMLRKF